MITTWFSSLFFTTTWNSNWCLSTCTCNINFMCTWITLTTMTFTKTFMISTIKRFTTTCLTWWTISITTLIFKKKIRNRRKSSFHTLRLHGCFPHERKRVHFVSQRYSWQHGIDFSFKSHRHRFKITCRHLNKTSFN